MEEQNLCPHCFSLLEEGETVCPECGLTAASRNPADLLPIGTVLGGRFQVGRSVHRNSLLAIYLAWDMEKGRKVSLEEFFPKFLTRAEDGCDTILSDDGRAEYQTMVSDLHDRWKRLIPLTHKALLKTVQLFSANGTIYRVTECRQLLSLEKYLANREGPLAPADAKLLMVPVISLLSQMHNMGLTHCGISPENIRVDSAGRVYVVGFALPELRTRGSGIEAELYEGYSAPEQYSKALWQGEWTDIYSVGAVFYRLFSGKTPVSAEERGEKDPLVPIASLCPELPDYLADAVMRAMEYDKKFRFKSMEQLSAAFLSENSADTAVFRPEQAARPAEKKTVQSLWQKPLVKWAGLGLLTVSLIINVIFAISLFGPPASPPEAPKVNMVEWDFTGYYLEAIKERLASMPGYSFEYRYEQNEELPAGVIVRQSLTVGQVLPEDGKLVLYVSRGPSTVPMPDLLGANETYAMRRLSDHKIQYSVEYDSNPETGGEEGTVVHTSIGPGEPVHTKESATADTVVITIKKTDPYA